jgi:hypothetical protein
MKDCPEARVDRHDEDQVDLAQDVVHRMQRGGRVQGRTGLDARLADLLDGPVEVGQTST